MPHEFLGHRADSKVSVLQLFSLIIVFKHLLGEGGKLE